MKHNQVKDSQRFNRRKVVIAIEAVCASVIAATFSSGAYAACAGTIASPVSAAITQECPGVGTPAGGTNGNVTNTDSTSRVRSATINSATTTPVATTLLQFDGQGRTLTNSGTISNNVNYTGTVGAAATRARTAINMGAYTTQASSTGGVFGATAPMAGVTSLNLPNATSALIGQTVTVGRFSAGDSDFFAGESRVITGVTGSGATATVQFSTALTANFAGDPADTSTNTLPFRYQVISNYGGGTNVLNNTGTISSQLLAAEITSATSGTASASNTAAIKAVTASVEGDYEFNNSGTISVKHDGIGNALAIEQGGNATSFTINNTGTISAERTTHLTLVTNTAAATTATSTEFGTLTAATVGNVNAINTQEEADEIEINNEASGVIRSKGDYAGTIYMRAEEKTIVNKGLIEHLATDGTNSKGFAIAAVSNPGDVRTLDLDNSGTIRGDILVVNGAALRWYALSTSGSALDSRLTISSQAGQSDSTITNSGTIAGNLFFSNGTHELTNVNGGSIVGNMDIDQRDTSGGVTGTKDFTFDNAGTYSGNITVRTAAASEVTLMPTVYGSGAGSTQDAPSSKVTSLGTALKIYDGTSATDGSNSTAGMATVAPRIRTIVHAGEWYKLSNTFYGDDLPDVSSINTKLVTWELAKNASGNLVLGVDTVKSLSTLGITGNKTKSLNALLNYSGSNEKVGALGAALQMLTEQSDIEKAGDQLRPEINGAAANAALGVTSQTQGVVDNRIADVHLSQAGMTGIATGESAPDKGFWVQAFGFYGEQDTLDGVDGYTANAGGAAFGGDVLLDPDTRVGGALSYARTGIDAKGVNNGNTTDMDSYQAMLYGSYLGKGWYINGNAGIGLHKYDTTRVVTVPVVDTATGSHDGWQYSLKVDGGYPIKMASATIIPTASVAYSHLSQDGYSEASNAGTGLTVSSSDTDSFKTGLGAKALITLNSISAVDTMLEGHGAWFHEFGDDTQDTTASFAGGGGTFTSNGVSIGRESFNLGASLKFSSKTEAQSLSISYDAEIRDEYVGQTGMVQARFDF